MPSFGEKLKLEREKRKITLEEISSSTKIGTRMLRALEEEKFNQLPGGIFNKGFVRAYARVVGLDEDQAVADYLQASGDAQPVRPEAMMGRENDRDNARDSVRETEDRISRLEAISDSPSRRLPWGAFAVILLAIALALSLWSHRRREQERLASHPPPAKTAVQSSGAPSAQENTPSSIGRPGSATQPSPVSAPRNSAPVPAGPSSGKTSSPSAQKTSDQNLPGSSGAAATPAPGEFMVVIQAREQSWISIAVDGKVIPQEILQPGGERAIRGRKEVVVKAGNAGGLDFRLDGKKLDVGGGSGEVKTVTIGHAGLLPNAAAPPSTP